MKFSKIVVTILIGFGVFFTTLDARVVKDDKISFIQFKDISLEDLFDYLSSRYSINIVLEEPALRKYTTSLRLRNVNVEKVIEIVSKEYGLSYTKEDGSYYISSRRKYHEENYNTQEYITKSVKVRYASMTDIVSLLKSVMEGTVVVRGDEESKPYRNLYDATPLLEEISQADEEEGGEVVPEGNGEEGVSVEGDMSAQLEELIPGRLLYVVPYFNENIVYLLSKDEDLISQAKAFIAEVDQPIREVLIQGKIISIGIDDGFSSFFEFNKKSADVTPALTDVVGGLNSLINVGNLQYTFLDELTQMNIEILQNEGRAKTIASPMLLTANRTLASLDLIEEITIITGWKAGTVSQVYGGGAVTTPPIPEYTVRNLGTEFEIIPYINDNDEILLKIKITVSSLKAGSQQILVPDADGGYSPQKLDGISETTIETTLITKDGQGIVLGGLINESTSKQEDKVPLLGDIPVLGFFFKDVKDVTTKSETVVILTPIIVDVGRSNAVKTFAKAKENIDTNRYILNDDEPEISGVKILDNLMNDDITKKLNDEQKEKEKRKFEQGSK